MTSKILDFTAWYELQADSESDEETRSPVKGLSYGHTHSSVTHHHGSDGSWHEPLHTTLDRSGAPRGGRGSLIQQLLNEMDDANQKINQYVDHDPGTVAKSYKSDGGMSLQEFPIDLSSRLGETDESGCDEAVSSAIAEVSKDFIFGNLSTGPLMSGESDDSHISSDNDFRHRRGAAYARYPETAAGLSDSDWNPYITESDTNTSPRVVAEFMSLPSASGTADSKLASLISSFNPPLCSTKTTSSGGKISKSSLHGSSVKTATDNTLHLSDIREKTEMSVNMTTLKPDTSISPPQLTGSKLSEYSLGKRSLESYGIFSSNASLEDASRNLRKCFERTSWPPSPGADKSSISDASARRKSDRSGKNSDSGVDITSMEERFKLLGNIGGLPHYPAIPEKTEALPGSGYFSAAIQSATTTTKAVSQTKASVELYSPAQRASTKAGLDKYETGKTSAANVSVSQPKQTTSTPSSLSGQGTVVSTLPQSGSAVSSSGRTHHEKLGLQVQQLLQETAYLTGSSRAKDKDRSSQAAGGIHTVANSQVASTTGETTTGQPKAKDQTTNLDYDRLHRDLQEIQDSLQTMGQPATSTPPPEGDMKLDSDNDTDIVPSTTTTPERGGRRLVWDYAADLGYGHGDLGQLEGMMSDATESSPLSRTDNLRYTSDGEETRTSGSSGREQGEEEEHHDDSGNLTLTGQHVAQAAQGGQMELEELISAFRTESRALENRYQAVRSQSMADKVFGILATSNPEQQVQGILSRVSAEEMRQRQAQVPTHGYHSSYSESSPSTSLPSFNVKGDDVRKRLNLSTLSDSTDASHLHMSSLDLGLLKDGGFAATSTAQTLISAQMKKMAERTFNHSIELRSPEHQVVMCYPVYSHQRDQPQYQQLQQELQSQLQQHRQQQQQQQHHRQQQQERGEGTQAPTQPREAWPEQSAGTAKQGDKVPELKGLGDAGDTSQALAGGTTSSHGDGSMEKDANGDSEGKDSEEPESPSSVTSPAESDKSSEVKQGKFRPYRPAGSKDVYYTESDTASIADSVTTVESTHTGSDDAMGPYFPSSVLGSRRDQSGSGSTVNTGIYSIRSKATTTLASSMDPPLPTIQERSTPDQRDRPSSEGSVTGSDGPHSDANTKRGVPTSRLGDTGGSSGDQAEDTPVANIMIKRQARVEDILIQRDAARRVGPAQSDPARDRMHSELLGRTRGEQLLDYYRAQKSGKLTSPDSHQRSRIPVRGPPPDYQTASRSKVEDQSAGRGPPDGERDSSSHRVRPLGMSSIHDELQSATRQSGMREGRRSNGIDESEESHLLRMIDEQVEQEITEKQRKSSSPDDSDTSPVQQQSGQTAVRHRSRQDGLEQHGTERAANTRLEETLVKSPRRVMIDEAVSGEREEVQHVWEAQSTLEDTEGQREVRVVLTDKRREEGMLERGRRQRDHEAVMLMEEGELEIEEVVQDKRREEAEILEQRHHEVQMAREREVLEARKQAEARKEAELRREAQARRDADARREESERRQEAVARREAELRREARARREEEMRREAEEEQVAAMRREEEVKRVLEVREAAQREEEAMRHEVEVARQMALRRGTSKDAQKQREAEEAIKRAGGCVNSNNHSLNGDGEDDRELLQRGYRILQQQEQQEVLDRQPVSHRAQLLREALEQEDAYRGRADLQLLWERFMGSYSASTDQESTFDTDKLSTLADLLRDPTHHLVHTFLRQREVQYEEDRRRAMAQREVLREAGKQSGKVQRSSEEEQAMLERELRREEARRVQQRQSSEEESNGSYGEILQQRERDRLKRREVRTHKKKLGKSPSPSPSPSKGSQSQKQPSPACATAREDAHDTLYSIPEDIGHTASPRKSRSPHKTRGPKQHSDVIDPNLSKLRQRISHQREKIGQERMKELRREQKLLKLKALLSAKHTGLLTDTAIAAHLVTISSTSAPSSDTSGFADSQATLNGSTFSNDTTTAKDSSTDMRLAKLARSSPHRFREHPHLRGNRDRDQSLEDFTVLLEDSSSQTESDLTPTSQWSDYRPQTAFRGRSRKRHSPSSHVSKHGGKSIKLHQMYSPYKRAEQPYSIKKTRGDRRSVSPFSHGAYSRMRDAGTMYPSPKQPAYLPRSRQYGERMVSQGVQTSPRTLSPCRDDQPATPVPLMTRGRGMHRRQREPGPQEVAISPSRRRPYQGRNVSPAFDSSGVAACLSPDRDRPRSASPPRGRNRRRSPSPIRGRSPSPVELRLQAWTERRQMSPPRGRGDRGSPVRGWGRAGDYNVENKPPQRRQQQPVPHGNTSWFIPLMETKPWRKPLKEQQVHTLEDDFRLPPPPPPPQREALQEKWRGLTREDLLREEGLGGRGRGEAARFYLNPSVRKLEEELGQQYDIFDEKPLCRMSLQEALLDRRPEFVSQLRQRQKRLQLSAENRKLQALVRAEQDRIFMDQKRVNANLDPHPYSENLHQPKRRVITKQEMKELTLKKYKRLPEVKEKELLNRRSEEYQLNRLRAKVFNKRVQRRVLEKVNTRACS